MTDPVVDARGLALGYGGRAVVEGLDLRIEEGEVVGLLGPNGSGKSTVVRGLLGLTPVLAGELALFGRSIDRFTERRRIGYVPQRQTVTGGIPASVSEVVDSGRLRSLRPRTPRERREDRARVAEAIDAVGLATSAHRPLAALSGGQQRRALFARALVSEPEFLILDEPTAGVDRANQQILADTLARVVEGGTTVLLITHELGPVERLATRAVALRDGRIVHDGAPADAPDEHHHDDDWHHDDHAEGPAELGPGLGLVGP